MPCKQWHIFTSAPQVTLFLFPQLTNELLVYQEVTAVLNVCRHFSNLNRATQVSSTCLHSERIHGRNVRLCLLDWGISLMTPTCPHDTLGKRVFKQYGAKVTQLWKTHIKVAFFWNLLRCATAAVKTSSFVCFGEGKLYSNQRLICFESLI